MSALITFLLSAALVAILLRLAARFKLQDLLLDRPNARSLHQRPTPRYGGIAIALAAAILLPTMTTTAPLQTLLVSALVLTMISAIDDRRALPVALRLTVHIGAAILVAYTLATLVPIPATGPGSAGITRLPESPWFWGGIVLAIVWMTNLFNFMDGADGLAGGMACIAFAAFALAVPAGAEGQSVANVSLVLAGAAAGFLLFNFPPATVFMGDAGAIPIGFLSGSVGLYGAVVGIWSWWFAPLVLSPFIVDATVTLARRVVRGEKIWLAHRDHYYQRLVLSGWSHRKTALSYYLLMLASAVSALIAQNSGLHHPIGTFWVITYALLLWYLERRLPKNKKVKPD